MGLLTEKSPPSPKDVLIEAIERLRTVMREAGYEEVPSFAVAKEDRARGFSSYKPGELQFLLFELPQDLALGNRCMGEVSYQFECDDDSFDKARRGYNITIDPFGNIASVCFLWTPAHTHSEALPAGLEGLNAIAIIEQNRYTRRAETMN